MCQTLMYGKDITVKDIMLMFWLKVLDLLRFNNG